MLAWAGGDSQPSIGFVRVPGEAVASVHPAGWESQISKHVPDFRASMSLWFGGEAAVLESSEAEVAPAPKASVKKVASSSSHPIVVGPSADGLGFFCGTGSRLRGGVRGRGGGGSEVWPAPGWRSSSVPKPEGKEEAKGSRKSGDPQLLKALFKMLERMEKSESKKDKKKKDADELWDPLGGSASDSEEESATYCSGGMRAMNSVHKPCHQVQPWLCDSQVCCAVLSKGQSSSYKLNRVMRAMLPTMLALDVSFAANWIGTKHNPADHGYISFYWLGDFCGLRPAHQSAHSKPGL